MAVRLQLVSLLTVIHGLQFHASPPNIQAGDWVTASWAGIPATELARNTSEYLCSQDSFCHDVFHLSAWIGVFPADASVDQIGPQHWGCANPPWLATSPIKWKPVNQSTGSTMFRIEAARTDLKFVLFSNGTSYPYPIATSQVSIAEAGCPRHVHLALGGSTDLMRVMFESFTLDGEAVVRYGYAPGQYTANVSAIPSTYSKADLCGPPANTHGWSTPPWFYSGLVPTTQKPGTRVFYSVGSNSMGWSSERTFRTPTPPGISSTLRVAVLADVGETYLDGAQYHWMEPYAWNTTNGVLRAWGTQWATSLALAPLSGEVRTGKQGPPSGRRLRQLAESVEAGNPGADVVVHIGDLAYATGYESEWDYFMSQIEPIASAVPYMIGQGNHERDYPGSGNEIGGTDSGGECGIPTQARFPMPTPSHRQDQGWYSFDQGPVHFLMMDTEMSAGNGSAQLLFMQADLGGVNKSVTPWTVVMGHRPMYSSSDNPDGFDRANGPWWPDVELVLMAHQVDLCLWGHVHNAEVTCPLFRGKCVDAPTGQYAAPVHAVVGNGGQSLSHFPAPSSTYPPVWSEWRFAEFGYSTILVEGADRLTMDFFADRVPAPNQKVHTLQLERGIDH